MRLAAGRAVIATAVGGTPDLLNGGRFGALVPARSPEQMARAIQIAMDSPESSLRLAAEGRAEVLRRYSKGRLLGDMAALYRELLPPRPELVWPRRRGPNG